MEKNIKYYEEIMRWLVKKERKQYLKRVLIQKNVRNIRYRINICFIECIYKEKG